MDLTIGKVLSKNDTGETGAHMAGILIPKQADVLAVFPPLDPETKNPRATIRCTDESGAKWDFQFIYYNNRFFGGTRNEYRLTGMTRFLREKRAVAGDVVLLSRTPKGDYRILFERAQPMQQSPRLKLSNRWTIITIKSR